MQVSSQFGAPHLPFSANSTTNTINTNTQRTNI